MEAEEGVLASSSSAITSDEGARDHFRVSLPRHQPETDASPPPQLQDGPTVVPSPYEVLQEGGPTSSASGPANTHHQHPEMPATRLAGLTPTGVGCTPDVVKKKRGRPRKYGPDGSVVALSPMPISASIPLSGDCTGAWQGGSAESVKKKRQRKTELGSSGQKIAYIAGTNFTPHVLTVNPGEDITMKIMSFSRQASRAVCILSANGTISNVTFRQPTSLGGTLTYEGRFEILSLSGSYTPIESEGTASRSGGMSVSLAGSDGRVVGGGLAGLLVAAGSVQVVLGSFLPGHQLEQKPKKQRVNLPASMPQDITNITGRDETLALYGGEKPVVSPAPAFKGEASVPFPDIRDTAENLVSFGIKESNGLVS
ncbi:hypothetical protein MLD38_002845 [Melastoma candidum]|uniref:Uncharacterized protein n=1 Tax=Melastoma candidum TaxID=119954 RepID=A0ACB9S0B1_9MYRT|nr:hypothetical protein MLD38_002845 [Melastoma candidum]